MAARAEREAVLIEDVNVLARPDAIVALAPLFEGAPRFLDRLVAGRPFESWASLFDAARDIAHGMPEADQVELVDAHPRLGAPPGSVSAHSFVEQGYASATGRDPDTADGVAEAERERIAAQLERLNDAYESRFGFRYCVFVAGRSRAELLPGFEAAMREPRDTELHRALDAVVDIARARQAARRPAP